MIAATLATLARAGDYFLDYAGMAAKETSQRTIADPVQKSAAASNAGVLRAYTIPAKAAMGVTPFTIGDNVAIRLFDDITLNIEITKAMPDAFGTIFLGSIDGINCVTLFDTPEGLQIQAQNIDNGRVYGVTAQSLQAKITEALPLPSDNIIHLYPENTLKASPSTTATPPDDDSSQTASTTIDLMLVFDNGALQWANANDGGITNFARKAVAKMNSAIANTDLDSAFNFRLVEAFHIDANYQNPSNTLDYAVAGESAIWKSVSKRRDEVGADIVSILIDMGNVDGTVGIGYSLSDKFGNISAFNQYAYNVSSIRHVASSHTLTHEIGHNLGAGHSNKQADSPGPQWTTKLYSSGYYLTGLDNNLYHTIMAYGMDGYGNYATEIPYFSSPLHYYQGVNVGTTSYNDNTRVITETYQIAASWRPRVVPLTYGLTFSHPDKTIFASSISVELIPAVPGQQIYYTLDGTPPTTSSTRYTAPIVLSETTTISAATYDGSNLSPIFYATYYKDDLPSGIEATHLTFTNEGSIDWTFTTEPDKTHDSVDAAIAEPTAPFQKAILATTITGPTDISFWYDTIKYLSTFKVLLDGETKHLDDETQYKNNWQQVFISVGPGTHSLEIIFENNGGYLNNKDAYGNYFHGHAIIDDFKFDAFSNPPLITPTSSANENSCHTFQDSMEITITAPQNATIHYTLDGTLPTLTSPIYTQPITITQSTLVTAIALTTGREPSQPVRAMYLERHPISFGEWTTDHNQVLNLAQQDPNSHVILLATQEKTTEQYAISMITKQKPFLNWAKANKCYLLHYDNSLYPDYQNLRDIFFSGLNKMGYKTCYIPTIMILDTDLEAKDVFMPISEGYAFNNRLFDGTHQSLETILSSAWADPIMPPISSQQSSLVFTYPTTISLCLSNTDGTIHYTLDGTPPTQSSPIYTSPITIDGPTTLQAAVWTSGLASSPLLYQEITDPSTLFNLSDFTWNSGGQNATPWDVSTTDNPTLKSGNFNGNGNSFIEFTVSGKGRLTYTIKAESYSWNNTTTITVDGTQTLNYGYNQLQGTAYEETFTNTFTESIQHTIRITHAVNNFNYFYDEQVELSNLSWTPQKDETATPIPVPYEWLKLHYPTLTKDIDLERAAASDQDGDGYQTYQEYLLGTDPNDTTSAFMATITIENGIPIIKGNVENNNCTYTIIGSDTPTGPFTTPAQPSHRFFKILVRRTVDGE